jgi:RHS repeat-associated protein
VNQYVYQSIGTGADQLSFMLFEEGRIRVVHPVAWNNGYDTYGMFGNLSLPDGKQGVYDYFVTDHQQNVRMILSEEVQYASNTATMESSRSSQEEPVFGRSGAGNELAASRYATPSGWQNASVGAQVSRLGSLSGNMVGPNTLQKVMAGDQMSATVQYFFQSAPGNSTPLTTMLLNTLGQLLSTGSQVGGLVKGNASAVTSQLSANPGFVNAVNPAQGGANTPQAYLTMVFFDERFEPIAEADGGVVRQQVAQSVGSGGSTLGLGNIKAPRNGYVLVYVSNSSEQPVYFDNLQVGKVNGNILEENHYYSFGLRISAISSRRFTDQYQGKVPNAYLYNGKELMDEDADLGWLEYGYRFYDPQIGRFQQIDPMADELSSYSPYHYAYNDPVGLIDFMGLVGVDPRFILSMTKETAKTLEEVVVVGHRVAKTASTASKVAKAGRTLLDFVPFVSGAVDIFEGIRDGDLVKVGGGAVSILFDAATMGGGSILKGGIKAGIKEGAEYFAKKEVKEKVAGKAVKQSTEGGLNLFKWGAPQTTVESGWKTGDRMLHLPNKGSPKANWKANSGALRKEMQSGKPIFDSYKLPNGDLIKTKGFLNAERNLLQQKGWQYNIDLGAWISPIK